MFEPRPGQREILDYAGGRMGISAVPGSGKTHVLSLLAADIVVSGQLAEDQEVLIVTLVNSAVDNFSTRIGGFLRGRGLLPNVGYRVRTLHGLAHDIVRERPALVGLADDFQIADERLAEQLGREMAENWLRTNPNALDGFIIPDLDDRKREWVYRSQLPSLISDILVALIRQAKDVRLTPDALGRRLEEQAHPLPLAEMGAEVYAGYQQALTRLGMVDFDDLVRLAVEALETDPDFLARLRRRWPYILEDEAQDSSRLQEHILRLLVGEEGNWVRGGDPNQAIYETFTTANPLFLRQFMKEEGVQPREMPHSGRSTRRIISLANYLIRWVREQHPVQEVRGALGPPYIEPTPPGDPQPNPPDEEGGVHFVTKPLTPEDELRLVVRSLARWLPAHQEETVAVLVPRNARGFEMVNLLKRQGIECVELLRSTRTTRETVGVLERAMACLADPVSPANLADLYRVWAARRGEEERIEEVARLVQRCRRVEDFIWPLGERDWLDEVPSKSRSILTEFRRAVRRWQGAASLPADQLLLMLAQDMFREPGDLAMAHKLAVLIRQMTHSHPDYRLPQFAQELGIIARNERRFLGLSEEDLAFDPNQHKGKAVVATVHKAKGLEWDRVYLMAVNSYNFPSGQLRDQFIAEKWFVRDGLNLEAEALAQLETLASGTVYREGEATRQARLGYVAERLRLLYMGITRARKELIVTWNVGSRGDLEPALALRALWKWEEE